MVFSSPTKLEFVTIKRSVLDTAKHSLFFGKSILHRHQCDIITHIKTRSAVLMGLYKIKLLLLTTDSLSSIFCNPLTPELRPHTIYQILSLPFIYFCINDVLQIHLCLLHNPQILLGGTDWYCVQNTQHTSKHVQCVQSLLGGWKGTENSGEEVVHSVQSIVLHI